MENRGILGKKKGCNYQIKDLLSLSLREREREVLSGDWVVITGFGLVSEKGNGNNGRKRKVFPNKSNPRVREEGHLCLFRSSSDQCPFLFAVPRIVVALLPPPPPLLTLFVSRVAYNSTSLLPFFSLSTLSFPLVNA